MLAALFVCNAVFGVPLLPHCVLRRKGENDTVTASRMNRREEKRRVYTAQCKLYKLATDLGHYGREGHAVLNAR